MSEDINNENFKIYNNEELEDMLKKLGNKKFINIINYCYDDTYYYFRINAKKNIFNKKLLNLEDKLWGNYVVNLIKNNTNEFLMNINKEYNICPINKTWNNNDNTRDIVIKCDIITLPNMIVLLKLITDMLNNLNNEWEMSQNFIGLANNL